jgi:hypothetical protein
MPVLVVLKETRQPATAAVAHRRDQPYNARRGIYLEVELNGKVVTRMDTDQWPENNKRPDGSEHRFDVAYKHHPRRGCIGLQDPVSNCWYAISSSSGSAEPMQSTGRATRRCGGPKAARPCSHFPAVTS